tara:strand:+ start:169 stop:528 length:360 start_codon:yes stop_codon:yes gene_type:complete
MRLKTNTNYTGTLNGESKYHVIKEINGNLITMKGYRKPFQVISTKDSIVTLKRGSDTLTLETKTYEVGVEVIENPSKEPNKLTYTTYEVEAISENEARRKASKLCADEFCHLPYTTEII